jgi:hypothetical protein
VNVIFLDIDGVLNSRRSVVSGYRQAPVDDGVSARMASRLDPIAVGLVNRLAVIADAKIVICSAWRVGMTVDGLQKLLGSAGLISERLVGFTDNKPGMRGEQIARYLSTYPNIKNYVWFDDEDDKLPGQNLVQTNCENGLCWAEYAAACKIFSCNPFDKTGATQ